MPFATIDVTKGITGTIAEANLPTIPVTKGGTGLTSGTTDQFLKFTGTTTIASAADNAGKILQLTTNQIVGERNSNSTSYVATNIHHNITPASSSNKVYVLFTFPSLYVSQRGYANRIKIYRHSAVVSVGGSAAGTEIERDVHMVYQGGSDAQSAKTAYSVLDTPSSTAAVYYQAYMSTSNSSNTFYIGQAGNPIANVTLMEIAA
tara:strand:+ start:63 stop:677 length:615 start_codon:yes stop_codon:yes gene_type:complete